MQKVSEAFPDKYHSIFSSILPGGNNWQEGHRECLKSCPYSSPCEYWGPSKTLCSDDWKLTPLKPISLMVLKHIFDNYDFYNFHDLPCSENAQIISEIRDILDFPFDDSLLPTEVLSVVKVRLRQAEFKSNLFLLWDGCSLEGCDLDPKYLIASHILPWAKSTNEEKVSKYNGLLLPANYDYLFDRHLISFSDSGQMLTATAAPESLELLYGTLGINQASKLRMLPNDMLSYLAQHREQFNKIVKSISNNKIQPTPKSGAVE